MLKHIGMELKQIWNNFAIFNEEKMYIVITIL